MLLGLRKTIKIRSAYTFHNYGTPKWEKLGGKAKIRDIHCHAASTEQFDFEIAATNALRQHLKLPILLNSMSGSLH